MYPHRGSSLCLKMASIEKMRFSYAHSHWRVRVWKHGCDTRQILIGYMPSDALFDWLVENISMYQENLFQSRIFLHLFPSLFKLSLRNIVSLNKDPVSCLDFNENNSTINKTNGAEFDNVEGLKRDHKK